MIQLLFLQSDIIPKKYHVCTSYRQYGLTELVERFRVVADRAWHSRVLDVPMFRKVIQDTQILMTNIKNELIKEINHEKQK